jgi:hypothetical protein
METFWAGLAATGAITLVTALAAVAVGGGLMYLLFTYLLSKFGKSTGDDSGRGSP